MKVKRTLCCLLAVFLLVGLMTGCNGGSSTSPSASSSPAASESPAPESPAASPSSGVPTSNTGYEDMDLQQLHDLALQEPGKIEVYSTSATVNTAIQSFIADYPDFADKIEYISLNTDEVADRVTTEVDTNNNFADLLMCKDNTGEIYNGLLLDDYVSAFYPSSVTAHIDPSLLTYGMPVYTSYNPWYYNTANYPDGAPITSWWDIVQGYNADTQSYKDASGKSTQYWTIYSKDITSPDYAALWTQLILSSDELAKAYQDEFGEPLQYTYTDKLKNVPGVMDLPENNAGVELFWRFSQMLVTELDDGDEVVSAVDQSLNGPTLGLTSGGKLKNTEDGMKINWVTDIQPYTAFAAPSYVYEVKGSDNPAGDAFFILYLMGGPDGTGDGYQAFNALGQWSVRDDVNFDKTPYTADQVNLVSPDFNDIYQMYPNVQAYWTYWTSLSGNPVSTAAAS